MEGQRRLRISDFVKANQIPEPRLPAEIQRRAKKIIQHRQFGVSPVEPGQPDLVDETLERQKGWAEGDERDSL